MPDLINPIFIQNEIPSLDSGKLPNMGELPEINLGNVSGTNVSAQKNIFEGLEDQLLIDRNYVRPDNFVFDSFYEKDALRYKSNERLWKEIGWNKYFPQEINDVIYDNLETKFESWGNVFPKLWYNTKFAFTNYFQSYADQVKSLAEWDNNNLINSIRFKENFEKNKLLEELYPNYQTDDPVSWWNVFRGEWWEEATPSVGFTLGTLGAAFAESALLAAATAEVGGAGAVVKAPHTARKVYKAISDFFAYKKVWNTLKTLKGANALSGVAHTWRLINVGLSEAQMEGGMNKYEFLESFVDEYIAKNGFMPSDEEMRRAKEASDQMAKATIAFQTPFLIMSNAIQFKNILGPQVFDKIFEKNLLNQGLKALKKGIGFGDLETKIGVKGGLAVVEDVAKEGIAKRITRGVAGSLTEGFEESYQGFVNTATQDYYKNKFFNPEERSVVSSISQGLDYMFSNEGLKEFMAGFVTGGMFQHVRKVPEMFLKTPTKVEKEVEKKVKKEDGTEEVIKEKVSEYDLKWYNKYLGLKMEKVNQEKRKEKLEKIAKHLNSVGLDQIFKREGILDYLKSKDTSFGIAAFLEKNDLFNVENLQNLELNRFLFNGLVTGKIDLQIEKIKQLAEGDFEGVKQLLELDETEFASQESKDTFMNNLKAFGNLIESKAKQMDAIYKEQSEYFAFEQEQTRLAVNKAINALNVAITQMKTKYGENLDEVFKKQQEGNFKQSIELIKQRDELTEENENLNGDRPFEELSDKEKIRDSNNRYKISLIQKQIDEIHNKNKELKSDIDNLNQLSSEVMSRKINFYAFADVFQQSILSQVGMMDAAKRAKRLISQMNSIDDSINFLILEEMFNIPNREAILKSIDNKIQELEKKIELNQELESNQEPLFISFKEQVAWYTNQLNALEKLRDELDAQFSGDEIKDINKTVDLLADYLFAASDPRKYYTGKGNRINKKVLKEYVTLQLQNQENLNLLNTLATYNNFEKRVDYISQRIANLLGDIAERVENEQAKSSVDKEEVQPAEVVENPPAPIVPDPNNPPPDPNNPPPSTGNPPTPNSGETKTGTGEQFTQEEIAEKLQDAKNRLQEAIADLSIKLKNAEIQQLQTLEQTPEIIDEIQELQNTTAAIPNQIKTLDINQLQGVYNVYRQADEDLEEKYPDETDNITSIFEEIEKINRLVPVEKKEERQQQPPAGGQQQPPQQSPTEGQPFYTVDKLKTDPSFSGYIDSDGNIYPQYENMFNKVVGYANKMAEELSKIAKEELPNKNNKRVFLLEVGNQEFAVTVLFDGSLEFKNGEFNITLKPFSGTEDINTVLEDLKNHIRSVEREMNITKKEVNPELEAAIKQVFDISEAAFEKGISYEEELRNQELGQQDNPIDVITDNAKRDGKFGAPSSKTTEIKNSKNLALDKPYQRAMFFFKQKMSDGIFGYQPEDFKLILFVEKGQLKGKVGDSKGNPLKFNEKGEIDSKGVDIIFTIDTISYDEKSIDKPRAVAAGVKLDPLTLINKNFTLHDSFKGVSNPDQRIIKFVESSPTPVYANIRMITQGHLVRPGITNDPMSLTAKNASRRTFAAMENKAQISPKIANTDETIQNTHVRKGSVYAYINRGENDEYGFEVIEFKPVKFKEINDHDGIAAKEIIKSVLERAIKGTLPIEYKNFLLTFINRRKYEIVPLANTLLLVNKQNFINLVENVETGIEKLSQEQVDEAILKTTSLKELMEEDINIDSIINDPDYNFSDFSLQFPEEVRGIMKNYLNFVKNNITTSVTDVQIIPGVVGPVRANKRIVMEIEKTFSDMNNEFIKAEPVSTETVDVDDIWNKDVNKDEINSLSTKKIGCK